MLKETHPHHHPTKEAPAGTRTLHNGIHPQSTLLSSQETNAHRPGTSQPQARGTSVVSDLAGATLAHPPRAETQPIPRLIPDPAVQKNFSRSSARLILCLSASNLP